MIKGVGQVRRQLKERRGTPTSMWSQPRPSSKKIARQVRMIFRACVSNTAIGVPACEIEASSICLAQANESGAIVTFNLVLKVAIFDCKTPHSADTEMASNLHSSALFDISGRWVAITGAGQYLYRPLPKRHQADLDQQVALGACLRAVALPTVPMRY